MRDGKRVPQAGFSLTDQFRQIILRKRHHAGAGR
jgi:hypothetical protein